MIVPASQVIASALLLAGAVIAAVLLIKGSRGRSRVTGVVGAVFMFLGLVVDLTYRGLLEPFVVGVSDDTLILILAARMIIGPVLTGAGVVLLTCALMVASGPRRPEPLR